MSWTDKLRVRQLKTLVVLHDALNLTHAATRLSISQPALSKSLRDIEEDIGVTLFERHSRGLLPTPFCDLLVERALLVINELERTALRIQQLAEGLSGQLRIGTTPVALVNVLPTATAAFLKAFPTASLEVIDGPLDQLLPQLLSRRLDFVISRIEDRDYGGEITFEVLQTNRKMIVTRPGHPLAARTGISWQDALAYPWIVPPAGGPLRRDLEQKLALGGHAMPAIALEASSSLFVASALLRSDLVAVMSEGLAHHFASTGEIQILPLAMRRQSQTGLLWRRESAHGALENGFLDMLRQASRPSAEPDPS